MLFILRCTYQLSEKKEREKKKVWMKCSFKFSSKIKYPCRHFVKVMIDETKAQFGGEITALL